VIAAERWREEARTAQATYPFFDHLGARQIDERTFEIWLALRDESGQALLLRTQIREDELLPSLADVWAGAQWCEREASEGYNISVGATDSLLISDDQRGVMRHEHVLSPRQETWPGSHEPSGKSRLTPLGRA
jgi:NADH-quinone oxidoreductase subunit C